MALGMQRSSFLPVVGMLVVVLVADAALVLAAVPGVAAAEDSLEDVGTVRFLQLSASIRTRRGGRNATLGKTQALLQVGPAPDAHSAVDTARELLRETQTKLAEHELKLQEELVRRKARYVKQLESQDSEIHEMQQKATALATANAELMKKVEDSRTSAKEIEKDIASTKARLEGLQRNFSTAQEYLNLTKEAMDIAMNSANLSVLRQLDREDEKASSQARTDNIRKTKNHQFVQLAERPSNLVASDIITDLRGDFKGLSKTQRDQLKQLDDWYNAEMEVRGESLQKAQASYNKLMHEKKALDTLDARMHGALVYLQKAKTSLDGREHALRRFSERLGIRPMPIPASRAIDIGEGA